MNPKLPSLRFFLTFSLTCLFLWTSIAPAFAQRSIGIIRDTEIEGIITEWSAPILKAANMHQNSVNIILVQSPQLNAFVAGGANIFFYTGLIERTENPGELIGVFAHELGHISGGHLISTGNALERASYESILGMVLGVGAAIATGNGEVANAIISGSSNIAARRFLSHSRVNESAADQAAMRYLEKAGMNPEGLTSFLKKLESEELIPRSQQSEYVRTHPLTSNRINALENRAQESPHYNKAWPAHWLEQHARMKAKLIAFTDPGRVPWIYSDSDKSMPARYARAIADYRQNNVDQALKAIDALIADEPDNPFFHELKGQMLVDFGRINESLSAYKRAVALLSNAPLIRIAYAHALIESRAGDQSYNEAIENLHRALTLEKRSARAHRLLATAYGRLGQEDVAKVHLAEEAVLQRKFEYAKRQAETALQSLPENSPYRVKAEDIISYVDVQKDLGN
ncbi:MAG: M48 family metalloprotease [Alphaproteobacteria bacterium]